MDTIKNATEVKAYSFKELSIMYGVNGKILRQWLLPLLEEIGKRNGWYYTPKQVRMIFERLGVPKSIMEG